LAALAGFSERAIRKKCTTQRSNCEAGGNIDEMMLVGGECRSADQYEPAFQNASLEP
jgi:hypothetical protein